MCRKLRGIVQASVKMSIFSLPRLLITFLQLVIVLLGFCIMLMVMSFNVGVFFAVVIGTGVGKAISRKWKLPDLKRFGKLTMGMSIYNSKED